MSKLTLNVSGIDDFSKLPIPFYCIATDIQTGQEVVLDHGNLAQAIAASSALPTLFQPVNLNNKLLMDGGIVNNFPIKGRLEGKAKVIALRKMGTIGEGITLPKGRCWVHILLKIQNSAKIKTDRIALGKLRQYLQ